jgi:hypothetical protein
MTTVTGPPPVTLDLKSSRLLSLGTLTSIPCRVEAAWTGLLTVEDPAKAQLGLGVKVALMLGAGVAVVVALGLTVGLAVGDSVGDQLGVGLAA